MNRMAALSRDVGVAPTSNHPMIAMPVGATPTSRLKPHSKDLRKGRYSEPNQVYLITTVTQQRDPVFHDFTAARILINTIKTEQTLNRADTLAFVVMPDHLHWLMTLGQFYPLPKVLQSLKTVSAKRIGFPCWQAGYHDHAIREEEDLQAIARYMVANPIRARLVEKIGDYPHWDAVWF